MHRVNNALVKKSELIQSKLRELKKVEKDLK